MLHELSKESSILPHTWDLLYSFSPIHLLAFNKISPVLKLIFSMLADILALAMRSFGLDLPKIFALVPAKFMHFLLYYFMVFVLILFPIDAKLLPIVIYEV